MKLEIDPPKKVAVIEMQDSHPGKFSMYIENGSRAARTLAYVDPEERFGGIAMAKALRFF
ncbi:MAG: hypothetical protein P4L69_24335 [Desulfosporosinus sp.]|nr:hypothetical protein [Desulfosporosinus sp.]